MMKEIPNYTGYFADEEGKIYSTLQRGCRDRYNLEKRVPPVELKPRKTKNNYCRVMLKNDKTSKRDDIYVHRIVASLFIPNPNNYPEVNHKDCNPENNRVDNLEGVSSYQNWDYSQKYGYQSRNDFGQFCHK